VSKPKLTYEVSMGFMQILRFILTHPDRKSFLTSDLKAAFTWIMQTLKEHEKI